MIRKAEAEPLMDIFLKPKLLFPKIDPAVIEPASGEQWLKLIYNNLNYAETPTSV